MVYPYNNLGAPACLFELHCNVCIIKYVVSFVCLRRNGLVEGYVNIVFRLHANSFPLWECVGNFINYFSWAGGSPRFKQSSAEFSTESPSVSLFSKFS